MKKLLKHGVQCIAIATALLVTACEESDVVLSDAEGTATAATYTRSNWMGSLNGSLTLAQFTIPGTHDSGVRYEPWPGTAICQNRTIGEQLTDGIRFLDIRCRHIEDAFTIHHGAIYQQLNFDDVLNACISFLNNNPTECIIMSVKEEHNPADNTRSFEETFEWYVQKNPGRWYLGETIPALDDVRGKIILFRRFGAGNTPKGMHASPWQDNTTFDINGAANMKVQDMYQVPDTNDKWNKVTSLLSDALSGSNDRLYVNFASGYKPGIFGIPDINAVANAINPNLTSYFTANTSGRFGAILMDFEDAARNDLIISTNF